MFLESSHTTCDSCWKRTVGEGGVSGQIHFPHPLPKNPAVACVFLCMETWKAHNSTRRFAGVGNQSM